MKPAPHVLVVAYDFPPHGAIGTMRTLRLVRHLDESGWRVTVLTGDPRAYLPWTPVEPALLERVPPDVRTVRAGAVRWFASLERRFRPAPRAGVANRGTGSALPAPDGPRPPVGRRGTLRGVKRELDMLLSVPDRENGWIVPAVLAGLRAARRAGRPDLLYSSAPPWSGQLVALALARRWRCPWVADFRDPWARAPWRDDRSDRVRRANARLERLVVTRADVVVFATRGNHDEFAAHYGPEAARRFHVVPNGCDPSEFEGLEPAPEPGRFVLLHAGSLYGGRNPLPLCRALARLLAEGRLDPGTFRLRFLGPVNPAGIDLPAECQALGLGGVVEFPGRVSRAESLRQMLSASALLLLQPGHTVSIPGKLYEYLAAARPILAVAEEGEIADLVRASGMGRSVVPADEEGLARALLDITRLASERLPRPDSALFDGRTHTARLGRLLEATLPRTRELCRDTDDAALAGAESAEKTATWES